MMELVLQEIKALAAEIVVIREQLARGAARFEEYDRTTERFYSERWPELVSGMKETLAATSDIRAKVGELEADVRRISHAVYGNGKPGLLQKVDGQGSSLDRLRDQVQADSSRIAVLEKCQRDAETREAERAGERRGMLNAAKALKAIGAAGAGGGIYAAIDTWLRGG